MAKIAEYNDGMKELRKDADKEDVVKISPSSISSFFTNTSQWYREHLLGEKGFAGSTATLLGTIIHHFAELAALNKPPKNPDKDVKKYLDAQTIDFDRELIEDLWKPMAQTLIDGCIPAKFHSVEQFIFHEVLPGIYAAGTYDALIDNGNGTYTIRDYKNSSTKPKGISYPYRMQAHTYAYILTKMGFKISHIELQFVTRPTKTLGPRHFQFREEFTSDHLETITSQIELIAESIQFWNDNPDKRHLLAQDARLKEYTGKDYSDIF